MEVLLQPALVGHPEALGDQPVAVQGRGRLPGDQPVGHHGVGLQKRSDHAVRQQQVGAGQQLVDLTRGGTLLDPAGTHQVGLVTQAGVELSLGREEELVLEQVAQGQGARPGGSHDVDIGGRILRGGLDQGHLEDRPVDEVVGDRVAVERGLVLPIGRDRVDGLQPAGVLHHDALAHECRQRLAQALGAPEVDVSGQRQLAASYVGDQRFEDAERLGQGHRATVVVEQPEGHQSSRGDRRGGVDAVGNLERDARHHLGQVVGLGARPGIGQCLAQ